MKNLQSTHESNNKRNIRTRFILPLILLTSLIVAILVIIIGIRKIDNKTELGEVPENLIQGAVADVPQTSIGENVIASFNGATGEISIASTSGMGTIDNLMLNSFYSVCGLENIKSITFLNPVYAPQDSSYLFVYINYIDGYSHHNLNNLDSINNLHNINTSNVRLMNETFRGCYRLETLDLSSWDTRNVTSMYAMFCGCGSLETIDLSSWDTSNVTDMGAMFSTCINMKSINLSNFKTGKVESLYGMFYNCVNLTTIDINHFDTSNVTYMNETFVMCSNLKILNISNWDMNKVTNATDMIQSCASLTDIYTPREYSAQTVELPSDYYNVTNTSDNNPYTSFTNGTFSGSVHLKKLVDYGITYNLDNGTITGNPATYNAFSNITLNNPVKTGYTFKGWTGSNGETPQETVSIAPRTLEGDLTYTANYEINKYTVTINPNGGAWDNKTTNSTISNVEYNSTKTIANPTREGHTFAGWTIEGEESSIEGTIFTMGLGNATLTANWTKNSYLQTIKTRYEKPDGTYTEYEDAINGNYEYGQTVNWSKEATEEYEGASIETYTVTEAKTTEITIRRKTYTLTLNKGTGIKNMSITPVSDKYRVGQTITIKAETQEGYEWSNWTNGETEISRNQEYTLQMPTENTTYTANGTPSTQTPYTVKHWQEKLEGKAEIHNEENYTLKETENQKGTTGENVTPETKTYEGFTSPSTETIEIKADGTTEINYYYTRNSYQQTIKTRYENPDGTYTEYEDAINENYEYGQTVNWSKEATEEYEAVSIEPYTVTEAKTTEITIRRKTYTLTLNKGIGIKNMSVTPVSDQYRVGQTITVSATLLDNTDEYSYTWANWTVGAGPVSARK